MGDSDGESVSSGVAVVDILSEMEEEGVKLVDIVGTSVGDSEGSCSGTTCPMVTRKGTHLRTAMQSALLSTSSADRHTH